MPHLSIVITNVASRTASAGVSAGSGPSAASTRALAAVRFRTRTWKQVARHRRAHDSSAKERNPLSTVSQDRVACLSHDGPPFVE
jgi:hypothetical protein